jgi:hypothetical protein
MVKPLKTKTKRRSGSAQNIKLVGALKKLVFFSLPYILCLVAVGTLFGSVVAYAVNSTTFQLQEVKLQEKRGLAFRKKTDLSCG